MKVTIKRSGGLAGLNETLAAIDSEHLSGAAVDRLRQELMRLTASLRPADIGADLLRYDVEIDGDGPPRRLTVFDDGHPETAPMKHIEAILALGGG